jgi:hypothetical protein
MAVFFLLLAFVVGVVVGDALIENESTGAITLFGQSSDQFTDGQLLLGFAVLGILFALLLVLSVSSTRRRRARRKERRTASREIEDRATELERDNARLRTDLGEREEALAGREAELAHRDRQLALKDEELARYAAVPGAAQQVAGTEAAGREEVAAARYEETAVQREEAAARREDDLPRGDEELGDRQADEVDHRAPEETAVLDHAAPGPPEASDRERAEQASAPLLSPEDTEPVAPLHDEPPWQSAHTDDRPQPAPDAGDRAGWTEAEAPAEQRPPGQAPAEGGLEGDRTRPEGAAERDAASAAEEERTRQVQRPDRNA